MNSSPAAAADPADPINQQILAVAEDRLTGFAPRPFAAIAERCGLPEDVVIGRLRALRAAGAISRVRQTLVTTNLAHGALVAWAVPPGCQDAAFDTLAAIDPFTGHVVIRSAEPGTLGAHCRLWTTVKVPQGFALERHLAFLRRQIGAEAYYPMPARAVFKLGVGHTRRQGLRPGDREPASAPPEMPHLERLTEEEWRVAGALMRELALGEMVPDPWAGRARAIGLDPERFCAIAAGLVGRGVIGRFTTVLARDRAERNPAAPPAEAGLLAWGVPPGWEITAGQELGRHAILTHAYWRDAGPVFGNVNLMGVVHAADHALVRAHKAAIDAHLAEAGIPLRYSTIFWSERSRVRPSQILPDAYLAWCREQGLDPGRMAS